MEDMTNKTDETLYSCPGCGYDGSEYKDGDEGWVSSMDDRTMLCAECGKEIFFAFQCETCKRWLAGEYYSDPDCNKTGRGVALCGKCAGY